VSGVVEFLVIRRRPGTRLLMAWRAALVAYILRRLGSVLSPVGFVKLAARLGVQDVRDTYQRSVLGPLWTTIGLGIQVLAIGLVFGILFGADLATYLPFLVISLVLWNLITSAITEASGVYVASERFIRQIELPSFFPITRLLSKTVVTALHNLVLVVLVLAYYPQQWNFQSLLAPFGLLLLVGNLYWVVTLLALAGSRFRDLGPIIAALLTVSFYVTPIIWLPSAIPANIADILLTYNPFFHLMEIIRGPSLGSSPGLQSWIVAVVILILGNLVAWFAAKRFSWRVVYWL
jgi:lipopolysaccharide transport system permease protein